MDAAGPARRHLSVGDLSPSTFAVVMATGIVSLALDGAGHHALGGALFWLNVGLYAVLAVLFLVRILCCRRRVIADLGSHAEAPGFFTLVAASCVLGSECVQHVDAGLAGLALWIIGLLCWLALTYVMLPGLMQAEVKPKLTEGLNGAWLLVVVGTQAVSVLASLLGPRLTADAPDGPLFCALAFWLAGSMLYVWLIALIFHRILFLPLLPRDLTPPYWINMGAMAISTLAGASLVDEASRTHLLTELRPFLEGMTLLFWATATWWIPVLLALGAWRHLLRRVPLTYEHEYWAIVFPLGMYAVCTQNLIRAFRLGFLEPIATVFVWISLAAWVLTFVGLARYLVRNEHIWPFRSGPARRGTGGAPRWPASSAKNR